MSLKAVRTLYRLLLCTAARLKSRHRFWSIAIRVIDAHTDLEACLCFHQYKGQVRTCYGETAHNRPDTDKLMQESCNHGNAVHSSDTRNTVIIQSHG